MRYEDVPWEAAACKGVWTPLFYPDQGQSEIIPELRRICSECPILEECREYAIPNESHGFWGGLTMIERARLRRRMRRSKRAA